jgi:hypothetical protein
MQDEHGFSNTGRVWAIPDRDVDFLASIDLLSRDPKNLQFFLDIL